MAFVGAVEDGFGFGELFGGDGGDEANAHVEGAEHLVLGDVAEMLEVFEQRRGCPGGEVDDRAHAFGQDAGEVFRDTATGDVGHARGDFGGGKLLDDGKIAAVGAHKGRAGLVLELVDVVLGVIVGDFEEEFAGERVAVGVEAI